MGSQVKVVRWNGNSPPSEQEAEARLRTEGYESFCWHDVPGASYPRHRHFHDECIWVLKGEIVFDFEGDTHHLRPGDRLYLPARVAHTAAVPESSSVTYLVGHKV